MLAHVLLSSHFILNLCCSHPIENLIKCWFEAEQSFIWPYLNFKLIYCAICNGFKRKDTSAHDKITIFYCIPAAPTLNWDYTLCTPYTLTTAIYRYNVPLTHPLLCLVLSYPHSVCCACVYPFLYLSLNFSFSHSQSLIYTFA